MMNNKIITYISFAKKSGSLSLGFDAIKSSADSKKAKLLATLCDVSEKTQKEVKKIAGDNKIKYIDLSLSSDDLIHIFYKKIVVFAIEDENLATAILNQSLKV